MNRKMLVGAAIAIGIFVFGCGSGTTTNQPSIVELEITGIKVETLDSDPPQYRLILTILEPDSCHEYDHVQTSFDPLLGSNVVHVSAFGNLEETLSGCDLSVNYVTQQVTLEDDFYTGVEYEVRATNLIQRFTGQTDPVSIKDVLAAMDPQPGTTVPVIKIQQPFIQVAGEAADIGSVSIQIYEFDTVTESYATFTKLRENNDASISWIAPPTFYFRGPVLGIQIGNSSVIAEAMKTTFGEF